jgi:Rieske Fe-S protein
VPKEYRVEFPQHQTYHLPKEEKGTLIDAVLVTWQDGKLPSILEDRGRGTLSTSEIEELSQQINVLSNHCAHLGCPVRWIEEKAEILCPCHGGIYDINGNYMAGPPRGRGPLREARIYQRYAVGGLNGKPIER